MDVSSLSLPARREFGSLDKGLLSVSIVCGAGYLIAPFLSASQSSPAGAAAIVIVIIKGLAVLPLALLAVHRLDGRDRVLLGGALALSSLGDVFLALRGGEHFIFGLLSFLVAHLLYIALFARHWPKPLLTARRQKLLIAVVLLFSMVMMWWLLPLAGGLMIPVMVYYCVLTAMVVSATLAGFGGGPVAVGAVLFMISDSLIGISRFRWATGGLTAGFLIWSTYYLAQYFIATGVIGERREAKR